MLTLNFFIPFFVFIYIFIYIDDRLGVVYLGLVKILFFKCLATLDHYLIICIVFEEILTIAQSSPEMIVEALKTHQGYSSSDPLKKIVFGTILEFFFEQQI